MPNINLPSFWCNTQSAYDAISTKDSNKLYFTTDTLRLFKGTAEYTKTAKIVTADPVSPEAGVIYINTSTGDIKSYTGTEFVTLVSSAAITNDSTELAAPTTKAIVEYIKTALATAKVNVSYDDDSKTLTVNGEGNKINGFITDFKIEDKVLKITTSGKEEPFSVDLPIDDVVSSGTYNTDTQNIELTLTSGGVVYVPAADLVDIYTGDETSTVSVDVGEDNVITANVKVSKELGNVISVKDDGIYASVDNSGLMKKMDTTTPNLVTISTADGEVATSTYTIGGTTLDTTSESNTKLATEAAIFEALSWKTV